MPIHPPPRPELFFDPRDPLGSSPHPGLSARSTDSDLPSRNCQWKGHMCSPFRPQQLPLRLGFPPPTLYCITLGSLAPLRASVSSAVSLMSASPASQGFGSVHELVDGRTQCGQDCPYKARARLRLRNLRCSGQLQGARHAAPANRASLDVMCLGICALVAPVRGSVPACVRPHLPHLSRVSVCLRVSVPPCPSAHGHSRS